MAVRVGGRGDGVALVSTREGDERRRGQTPLRRQEATRDGWPRSGYFPRQPPMEKPPAAAAPAAAEPVVVSDSEKAKIKKQVEFYFSDSNFPRDKFLRTESSKDPDGCTLAVHAGDLRSR